MKGSEFIFDYVYLLYYKCNNKYIDSLDWIETKKQQLLIPSIKKMINAFDTL